jgi:hypothetical protein
MSRNGPLLGLSVILLTGVGLALAAFGPATFLYPPPGADITGTASLWRQSAIGPAFGLFALVMAAAGLSIAFGAAVRARGSHWLGWIGCIALAVGAAITLPGMSTVVTPAAAATTIPDSVGIGVYFAPAVLAGLLTAIVGMATRPQVGSPTWT